MWNMLTLPIRTRQAFPIQAARHIFSVAMLLALVLGFAFSVALAQTLEPESPPLVRLTGALIPVQDQEPNDLPILRVSIKGTKWILKIVKIEKLTGKPSSDLQLLQSFFPPQLQLTGPRELIDSLREPGIAGKLLTIEGRLYTGDRLLFVIAVKEGTKN
jgi:hypothetical protein